MKTKTIFIALIVMLLLIPVISAKQVEDQRSKEIIVYYSICEFLKSEFNMILDNLGHATGQGHNIDLDINETQYDRFINIFGNILDYPENNTIFHEMHGVWNFQCIVSKLTPEKFKMTRQGTVPPLSEGIMPELESNLVLKNRNLILETGPDMVYTFDITNVGLNESYDMLEQYTDPMINLVVTNNLPYAAGYPSFTVYDTIGIPLISSTATFQATNLTNGRKVTYGPENNVTVIVYEYSDGSSTVIEVNKSELLIDETMFIYVKCPVRLGTKSGAAPVKVIAEVDCGSVELTTDDFAMFGLNNMKKYSMIIS